MLNIDVRNPHAVTAFSPYPGWRYRFVDGLCIHEPATFWARLKFWLGLRF